MVSVIVVLIVTVFSISFENLIAHEKAEFGQEALFVRRIMEFWKDKEHQIVKSQIKQFIAQYPQSVYVDSLYVILGDTYWIEKNYENALQAYHTVQSPILKEKVFSHQLDCLHHLGDNEELIKQVKGRLPVQGTEPENSEQQLWMFYYAEALLRQAKQQNDSSFSSKIYQEALIYYESLIPSDYEIDAQLALGHIYAALGGPQSAVELYLQMVELHPQNAEEWLFYAARLQSSLDPQEAIKNYSRVQEMQGAKSSDAIVNKALLMDVLKLHHQILKEKEAFQSGVDPDKRVIIDFLIGRSHFALQQYEQALEVLRPLFETPTNERLITDKKAILLILIASAYHLNELADVQTFSSQVERLFPEDPVLGRVWYLEALTYKNCDRFQEAQAFIEQIIKKFPADEHMEEVEFERSHLLFLQRCWEESRQGFIAFAQKYPSSHRLAECLQFIVNATGQCLAVAERNHDPCEGLSEKLIGDIQLLLNTPDAVTEKQRPFYLLKLSKIHYDLEHYQTALSLIKNYLQSYPKDAHLDQANLLAAMCYHDGFHDAKNFAIHAEKVLLLNNNFPEKNRLHLNLFSTYFQLAKQLEEGKSKESTSTDKSNVYIDKAAEHLYAVVMDDTQLVKREHQLWLANYYYDQVRANLNEYAVEPLQDSQRIHLAERAVAIYLLVLGLIEENSFPSITIDNLYLEQELFKLSNLYGWLNCSEKQIAVLKNLVRQQTDNSKWPWNCCSRTLFALAAAFQQREDLAQAIEMYSLLTTTLKAADPYVASASKLQLARLSYCALPQDKKHVEDPEMMMIFKYLKDLQIRKSLAQEPVHLEAALEYVRMRSEIESKEKQAELMRFLLLRVKEDFTSNEDVWSKDYHTSRQLLPEKDLIFQAYLMLVEAHLARLDATIACSQGLAANAEQMGERAKSLYSSLLEGKFAITKYLIEQAHKGLEIVNELVYMNLTTHPKARE
jgi:outer membrane protein assembly factor BamD (BamD/ComL family)